jgi:hypothetical protein
VRVVRRSTKTEAGAVSSTIWSNQVYNFTWSRHLPLMKITSPWSAERMPWMRSSRQSRSFVPEAERTSVVKSLSRLPPALAQRLCSNRGRKGEAALAAGARTVPT